MRTKHSSTSAPRVPADSTERKVCEGLSRRGFLGAALAAGAGAAAVSFLPASLRPAMAATRPDAPARRLLVINCSGAMRSSAAFYAAPSSVPHNPWGVIDGTGTPFPLGKLLDDFLTQATPTGSAESAPPDSAYTLSATSGWGGARVPRLREMAQNFTVLGTWNENRGDHVRSRAEETTGAPGGAEPGLLTRIYDGLRATAAASAIDVPAFHVAPVAAFGQAPGTLARYQPVRMAGVESLPSASRLDAAARAAIGYDWASGDTMRDRLDQRRLTTRQGFSRQLVEIFTSHRQANRRIGARLAEHWLNIENADPTFRGAAQGQVLLNEQPADLTNQMLYELMVLALGPDSQAVPTQHPYYSSAINAGLGVRLLQLGAPAVVVEVATFDLHSNERQMGPPLYRFLGRLWATLNWLLGRMPDPEVPGKTMLDTTLVTTMSDFGRDKARANGFNAGDGSDHGQDSACFFLAHALMGGGIVPGKLLAGAPLDTFDARQADERFGPRQLLATLMWALGLDQGNPDWGFADVAAPIEALFQA
jgi:hypothetical protein